MADSASVPAGIHARFIDDDIAVIWLNKGENLVNNDLLQEMNKALDTVESNKSTKALIVAGIGNIFCLTLDSGWLGKQDDVTIHNFVETFVKVVVRLLVFPVPTVAAINGHAIAAGGFFAMACDYRIMCKENCLIGFPEITVKVITPPPFIELLRLKLPNTIVFRDLALYGQKLNGEDAKQKGVVDDCVDKKDLMDTVLAFIKTHLGPDNGFDRNVVQQVKQYMYGDKVDKCENRDNLIVNFSGVSLHEMFEGIHKAKLAKLAKMAKMAKV